MMGRHVPSSSLRVMLEARTAPAERSQCPAHPTTSPATHHTITNKENQHYTSANHTRHA